MSAKVKGQHETAACRWSVPACRFDMLADDDVFESIWLCERGGVPAVTSPEQCRSCADWEAESDGTNRRHRPAPHRP